jgi:putative ABC transport system permease protein
VPRLALRQAWRDLRAGELRLLVLALVLAVAALSAVGFFAARLEAGLQRDAAALIGGDLVLASDQALPADWQQRAESAGLRTARNAVFPTMARAPDARGGGVKLVSLKAVSAAWPLRGEVRLRPAPGQAVRGVRSGPAPGSVWVDVGLFDALRLQPGDTLALGERSFTIAGLLVQEPDRGTGFLSFAPRVLMHEDDLAATGLVQPGSRIAWRLALATPAGAADPALRAYRDWAQARLDAGQVRGLRIDTLDNGRPEMRQTLDRAQRFLSLVALLAALLAAVAVAIAARDHAQRRLDEAALLRVLGAPQRAIAGAQALAFGVLGLLASALGVALGWAVHFVFVQLLAGVLNTTLPPPGWRPALFGLGVGMTLLLGFGLPPVLRLARVPALRVLRRDLGQTSPLSAGVLVAGALAFGALMMAAAGDLTLGLVAVGGSAAALGAFALAAWGAVAALRRAVPRLAAAQAAGRAVPRWLLLATRQVAARPALVVLQVSSLSLGLLALVLLVLLRTDLIASWRQATPPDAPDRFVINLQPDQAEPFRARLKDAGIGRHDWFPMIRGRLLAINGQTLEASRRYAADPRAQRLAEREFNLSHTDTLPEHNRVVGGRWQAGEADGLSVEEGLAQTLGLKLGDTLRFDIAGQTVEGRVSSLRKVDWGSMRVNFFVLFPRAQMPDLPLTYISAFRVGGDAAHQAAFDRALAGDFPNLTLIDLATSLAEIQRVLDQVIRAVEFIFVFTLAAGLLVLVATINASREHRAREYAVMRAVGASSALLARMQRAELLGVGALAGLLATLAALAIGAALARQVFEFTWAPSPWVPLAGLLAGALLAWAAGWASLRGVLRRPVMATLRDAAA